MCRRETVENLEKVESVCVSFSTSCDVLCKDLSLLGRQMRLSVERLRIWHISPSSECEDAKMPLAMLMILELKVTPRIFENFFLLNRIKTFETIERFPALHRSLSN